MNEEAKKPRMNEWRMKKYKNKEAKKYKNWRNTRKKPRTPRMKNSKNQEPHKINFKYFTIFNTSLFYKLFSTTSKSI